MSAKTLLYVAANTSSILLKRLESLLAGNFSFRWFKILVKGIVFQFPPAVTLCDPFETLFNGGFGYKQDLSMALKVNSYHWHKQNVVHFRYKAIFFWKYCMFTSRPRVCLISLFATIDLLMHPMLRELGKCTSQEGWNDSVWLSNPLPSAAAALYSPPKSTNPPVLKNRLSRQICSWPWT